MSECVCVCVCMSECVRVCAYVCACVCVWERHLWSVAVCSWSVSAAAALRFSGSQTCSHEAPAVSRNIAAPAHERHSQPPCHPPPRHASAHTHTHTHTLPSTSPDSVRVCVSSDSTASHIDVSQMNSITPLHGNQQALNSDSSVCDIIIYQKYTIPGS